MKVLNNGKYWFFKSNGKIIVLPLPGDLIIMDGEKASLVVDNSFYIKDGETILEVMLLDGEQRFLIKGGSSMVGPLIKKINFMTLDSDKYKIYRGLSRIYPIGFVYLALNKAVIIYNKIVTFFKSLSKK
tara:strand:- start:286 stop:672 length:387 start_codon:yes stop_codon:yes gene_type:complete